MSAYSPDQFVQRAITRMHDFCAANDLNVPHLDQAPVEDWPFGVCAYYRKNLIKICVGECARPATATQVRNWNWPGSTVDRTPYGVICHELAHHCDHAQGAIKGKYWSEYGEWVMNASGEFQISGYCPNPSEWFAEMMRVFITNHALLAMVRPKTHAILLDVWEPVSSDNWLTELGPNCPERILKSLERKMPNARR